MQRCLGLSIAIILAFVPLTGISQTSGWVAPDIDPQKKASTVIIGENVFVVWFTDKGMPNTNGEVIFRASTDGGDTFGEKINLSNTTEVDSVGAEIAAYGETIAVTWWEKTNQTDVPVMRVSNNNGKTFGPLLELGVNGTLGTGEAKPLF